MESRTDLVDVRVVTRSALVKTVRQFLVTPESSKPGRIQLRTIQQLDVSDPADRIKKGRQELMEPQPPKLGNQFQWNLFQKTKLTKSK